MGIIRTANLEQRLAQRDVIYAYADDVNFAMIEADEVREEMHRERQEDEMLIECQCAACRAHQLEEHLPRKFAEYGMQMNAGKTTHGEFKMGNSSEAQLITVGNDANGKHECAAWIQSANTAFNFIQRIWLRKASLSVATKMKLYNSCVQPRMMYNAGASVYTRVELDKLDAAHRRHLRRILGVFYPEHITNEETYRRTEARPISIDVVEKRWTLLGHTLRLAKDTTGNKVITQYLQNKIAGANEERKLTRRGRVLTTLPRLFSPKKKKITPLLSFSLLYKAIHRASFSEKKKNHSPPFIFAFIQSNPQSIFFRRKKPLLPSFHFRFYTKQSTEHLFPKKKTALIFAWLNLLNKHISRAGSTRYPC